LFVDADMSQDQRHHTLTNTAKTNKDQATGKLNVHWELIHFIQILASKTGNKLRVY
jgi:hypothetical protein